MSLVGTGSPGNGEMVVACHDRVMGLIQRLLCGADNPGRASAASQARVPQRPAPQGDKTGGVPSVTLTSEASQIDLVALTGTTTNTRDAMAALANRYMIAAGRYLEIAGTLRREPGNTADPNAIAVHVEGERIGYLPGYVAGRLPLPRTGARAVLVQIFAETVPAGLRVEAWTWLGQGAPRWHWSATNRPPMSPQAKAAASQQGTNEMVAQALAGGGSRAELFRAGMVDGVHYLQLVEPIKNLKRAGQLEESLRLCYIAIAGAEDDRAGREPAPWYTEQAAIIHRKLGQRDEEIAVLRRWLKLCPPNRRAGSTINARLNKLLAK